MPQTRRPQHHRHRLTIATVGSYVPAWISAAFLGVPPLTAIVMFSVLAWWLWRHL